MTEQQVDSIDSHFANLVRPNWDSEAAFCCRPFILVLRYAYLVHLSWRSSERQEVYGSAHTVDDEVQYLESIRPYPATKNDTILQVHALHAKLAMVHDIELQVRVQKILKACNG